MSASYMSLLCDLAKADERYDALVESEAPLRELLALQNDMDTLRRELAVLEDESSQRLARTAEQSANPHGNPFAFLESDNPLEWDHFFCERTMDLLCLNSSTRNTLNFVVEVRDTQTGETMELERLFFLPPAFECDQECLRSDLREKEKGFYYLKNCEETAAYFKPWGSATKTYTPLYIEYVHP